MTRKSIHAVAGILKRKDKILIARRPLGKPYSGYWEFPGGKVEANESSKAALKRELYEELGIEVIALEPWLNTSHPYPDKDVFLEVWLINEFFGEPKALEKQILRWATLQDILDLPMLEGNREIINNLRELW